MPSLVLVIYVYWLKVMYLYRVKSNHLPKQLVTFLMNFIFLSILNQSVLMQHLAALTKLLFLLGNISGPLGAKVTVGSVSTGSPPSTSISLIPTACQHYS